MKIALAMIVKNEEAVLARCLESAKPYVDEIIVVDTGSTDQTREIARTFTSHVYEFAWCDDFAKARNEALKYVTADWVLVLDADEEIVHWDREAVAAFMKTKTLGRIETLNRIADPNGEKQMKATITRFFPKGIMYTGRIHEQVNSSLPRQDIAISVSHDGYFEKDKSPRNIPLLEQAIQENPSDPYLLFQLAREYKKTDLLKGERYYRQCYDLLTKQESYYPLALVEYLYILLHNHCYKDMLGVIRDNQERLKGYPDFHFVSALCYTDFILAHPDRFGDKVHWIEQAYMRAIAIGEKHSYTGVVGTGSFLPMHNLGIFYDLFGKKESAKRYFQQAADLGYEPSKTRLAD